IVLVLRYRADRARTGQCIEQLVPQPLPAAALEGDTGREEPGAGHSAGDDAAELDGVELVRLARAAVLERPAGGAVEDEGVRPAMPPRPFGAAVGDRVPVVVGVDGERTSDGAVDVEAVHPPITRVDDVVQATDAEPTERRGRHPEGAGWPRQPPGEGEGHRRGRRERR